jgi:tetratricopeptide (TPR) repeat protein
VLLLTSCSTEKAKWTNIQYHNTTCHYNVWWNGNESLKAGIEKLKKDAVDDYTTLLPPEYLGTADAARSIYPEMDRAIEKGVKGIKKHSIFVGGEEHVPYIKECYLLTAYATFYKQDYVSTANTCNILISQFKGTHAADEGAVLLARCMTQEKRYSEAEATLDQLVQYLAKGNFGSRQRDKLYLAMVEATVPQEKYKKAVEYIHLALESTSSNQTKARLTFLLAQIYQKLDRRAVASKYYHKVLSYAPAYVMEFNARLGEASCADLEHSDIQKLEKQLDVMLRDKKNEEYRDQIYYAKGEMFLGAKDAQKACENFKLSVETATANKAQKAKSALRLGEILYDIYEDYDQAEKYYTIGVQEITPDYPGYSAIKRRSDILKELCSFTRIYTRCDSLLVVAAMPEAERDKLIQDKIDTLRAQEERAKEKALLDELNAESKAQMNTLKGDWYFYNQNTVQKGKDTFRQRWGTRTLEDNWCFSHKPSLDLFSFTPDDEESEAEADSTSATTEQTTAIKNDDGNPDDPHNRAFYLKDLPTTQAQFDSIDSLTAVCLLGAGYVYYDGIHNIPRALECYQRLASDYTGYDHIVQTFYMLYRIYDRQGNTPQANYYRDMVLMGFPDSDFANLIRDNEYYKELLRRESIVEEAYEDLYTQFGRRRYSTVVTLASQAEELYAGHPMLPKFNYWKGLAQARQGETTDAISTFRNIIRIANRADSIVPLAQAQLDLLLNDTTEHDYIAEEIDEEKDKKPESSIETKKEEVQAPVEEELPAEAMVYHYREGQSYYAVVIVDDRHLKATEVQYRIADFNTAYYSNSGYRVNAILFTDSTQLITIHKFKDENEAMNYYRHLQQEESPLRQYADQDHQEFIISTQNYATFYNRKNPAAYEAYFKKYHLKNK